MTEEIQRAQAREMYASLLDVSSPERAGAALMIDVVYGTVEGFARLGVPYMPHILPERSW